MLLGYNTNGLAHHRLEAAIDLVADLGYQCVAITLDHHILDPFCASLPGELRDVRKRLQRRELASVIETGARFLLDPWHKHEPTLMSRDPAARRRRIEFLCRAIDIARDLGALSVSLWSGAVRDDADEPAAFARLERGLAEVLAHAEKRDVVVAFEPEPGMFIDTMTRFEQLRERLDSPKLQLTIDIGHLHCMGETPIADQLRRHAHQLVNVHIEDMRAGVHEHLMFGEGEIDFQPVIAALVEIGFGGAVCVELSRHSHLAPEAARRAFEFLTPLVGDAERAARSRGTNR